MAKKRDIMNDVLGVCRYMVKNRIPLRGLKTSEIASVIDCSITYALKVKKYMEIHGIDLDKCMELIVSQSK